MFNQSYAMKIHATRRAKCLGLSLLAMALALPLAPAARAQASDAPDSEIRDVLREIASAADVQARAAAWERLEAIDKADRPRLIQELVRFARDARGTREAAVSGSAIRQLGIADREVIEAVAPLLESPDDALRAQAANILGGYEQRSADRPPDFSTYREIIAAARRENAPLPMGLVRHMYATDPGQALLAMMRAFQIHEPERLKEILWAEHVVADVVWKQRHGFLATDEIEPRAAEQLARLAGHDAWWARHYVAEIMVQHPAFRAADVLEALQEDEHPMVREAAKKAAQ